MMKAQGKRKEEEWERERETEREIQVCLLSLSPSSSSQQSQHKLHLTLCQLAFHFLSSGTAVVCVCCWLRIRNQTSLFRRTTCRLYLLFNKHLKQFLHISCAVFSHSVVSNPMDCSLPGSFVHGDSPDRNTGVGCHFLLQGIFLTQGLNLCLLHLLHWQAGSLPPVPIRASQVVQW